MPSPSKAAHRFWGEAASNPEFARAKGVSQEKAREFLHADKGRVAKLPERVSQKKTWRKR